MNVLIPIIVTVEDEQPIELPSDEKLSKYRDFLAKTPINRRIIFTLKAATFDRYIFHNYESIVVGRFFNGGKLWLSLSDGYVFAVDEYLEAMHNARLQQEEDAEKEDEAEEDSDEVTSL